MNLNFLSHWWVGHCKFNEAERTLPWMTEHMCGNGNSSWRCYWMNLADWSCEFNVAELVA